MTVLNKCVIFLPDGTSAVLFEFRGTKLYKKLPFHVEQHCDFAGLMISVHSSPYSGQVILIDFIGQADKCGTLKEVALVPPGVQRMNIGATRGENELSCDCEQIETIDISVGGDDEGPKQAIIVIKYKDGTFQSHPISLSAD